MTPTTIIVDDNMNGDGDTTMSTVDAAAAAAADVASETTSIFNGYGTIDKRQKKDQKHSNLMYLRRLLTTGVLFCAVLTLKQSSSPSSSEPALSLSSSLSSSSSSSITVMDETATTNWRIFRRGGGPTAPPTVSTVTTKPLVMNNNLNKIHFGGRWWENEGDGSMMHSWGVGIFIVRIKGSTKLTMHMKSPPSGAYYTCLDDKNFEEHKVFHDNNNGEYVEVASGLDPNMEYIIRCGRSSEASYGFTSIYGVKIEEGGELLQAVDPNADNTMLRFEAIGDSITAGFEPILPWVEHEDVLQSYSRFMAEAWKTEDFNVIARSGISILPYLDPLTKLPSSEVVMSKEWPCQFFWYQYPGGVGYPGQTKCPVLWDFTKWQADVVTINLGTNDKVYGDPTQQEFRGGYLRFIQDVRSKYPNALIACIEPLLHSCLPSAIITGIDNGMEQAVTDMNDPKVIYYKTGNSTDPWLDCGSTSDYVDSNTHPTVAGHRKFATKLLDEVTKDVRKFFPNKCGGSGSSCEIGPPSPTPAPFPTPAPQPIVTPTLSPISPTNGNSCVAILQNQLPDGKYATTDSLCAPCSTGQAYWPCDTPTFFGLCRCS